MKLVVGIFVAVIAISIVIAWACRPVVQSLEASKGVSTGAGYQAPSVKTTRIGDEVILRGTARLMVQEGAFWMQQKARSEHDNNSLFKVWDSYDYVDALSGDKVKVITFTNDIGLSGVQVEIENLYGGNMGSRAKLLGRRGWMSSNMI